jgi:hypothetical protein
MRAVVGATIAVLVLAGAATAGGFDRTYLVPAIKQCPGPASCVPREFESSYTFDAIILRSPASKYLPSGKAPLMLDVRGVRDASHALVTGNLTLKVSSGRVSLPTLGTFPDDSPLVQMAPMSVPLKNGRAMFAYSTGVALPNGIITNGAGVEVLDPEGKRLAVIGSQSKP